MKTIPLILMGCGGVGSHLLQHIVSSRSLHSSQVIDSHVSHSVLISLYIFILLCHYQSSIKIIALSWKWKFYDDFLWPICLLNHFFFVFLSWVYSLEFICYLKIHLAIDHSKLWMYHQHFWWKAWPVPVTMTCVIYIQLIHLFKILLVLTC